jgi:outer membrane lipoprotein carrier protein
MRRPLALAALLLLVSAVWAVAQQAPRPAPGPATPAPGAPPPAAAPPTATPAPAGTAPAPAAPAPRAGAALEEVLRGLEGAYGKMQDLRADFSQTAFNKSLNQTIPAEGTVYMKRGGKLRWEYREPTPQEIVSDGKTLWVYTPTLNQVNVGAAPEALAGPAGSFLSGLGRLREHFHVRFLNPAQPRDAEGLAVLDLAPKQPLPTLTRLVLSLDPKSWEVRRAIVHDQFENTVTMKFTRLTVNSGLADTLFTFVPPKGVATVPLK